MAVRCEMRRAARQRCSLLLPVTPTSGLPTTCYEARGRDDHDARTRSAIEHIELAARRAIEYRTVRSAAARALVRLAAVCCVLAIARSICRLLAGRSVFERMAN